MDLNSWSRKKSEVKSKKRIREKMTSEIKSARSRSQTWEFIVLLLHREENSSSREKDWKILDKMVKF